MSVVIIEQKRVVSHEKRQNLKLRISNNICRVSQKNKLTNSVLL